MSDGTVFAARANAQRMGAACHDVEFSHGPKGIPTLARNTANLRVIGG